MRILIAEAAEQFYGRSYWALDRVFVYPRIRNKGKLEIWKLQKAVQYVNYLENNERANQQRN